MLGGNHILRPLRTVRPLRGNPRPTGFHLPAPWDAKGLPPFMDRLAFGFDAQNVKQFTIKAGAPFARPRCFATGKLPVASGVPLLAPANDAFAHGVLNFTPTVSMRWNGIRLRSSNVTHFCLQKPQTSGTSQSYLLEFGTDVNTAPGSYFYGGGEGSSAFRSDPHAPTSTAWVPSAIRHAWHWPGSSLDPDGQWRTHSAKLDCNRRTALARVDGFDVGTIPDFSGAPSHGWPNSPRAGIVGDVYVGARAGWTLPFNGRLACHLVYCDLDDDEIPEVERWINERWGRNVALPAPLVHIVAADATGTHGSAITGIVERVTLSVGATTGTMPKLNAGALNGHATLLYDGNYSLKFPGIPLPRDITVVVVSKRTNGGADHEFIEHGPDANSSDGFYFYSGGNGFMGVRRSTSRYSSHTTGIAGSAGTWYTRTVKSFASGTFLWHTNSGVATSGTSTSGTYGAAGTTTADLWVGSRNGSVSGLFTRGEFAEIRIYPGTLTNTQNTQVHEELRAKYGHY